MECRPFGTGRLQSSGQQLSKLAPRDLADHSACTTVRCPARWVLLSAVPVFWLGLTKLDHILNEANKRSTGDRIECQ
jgi:hypothetical protein